MPEEDIRAKDRKLRELKAGANFLAERLKGRKIDGTFPTQRVWDGAYTGFVRAIRAIVDLGLKDVEKVEQMYQESFRLILEESPDMLRSILGRLEREAGIKQKDYFLTALMASQALGITLPEDIRIREKLQGVLDIFSLREIRKNPRLERFVRETIEEKPEKVQDLIKLMEASARSYVESGDGEFLRDADLGYEICSQGVEDEKLGLRLANYIFPRTFAQLRCAQEKGQPVEELKEDLEDLIQFYKERGLDTSNYEQRLK